MEYIIYLKKDCSKIGYFFFYLLYYKPKIVENFKLIIFSYKYFENYKKSSIKNHNPCKSQGKAQNNNQHRQI